MDIQVQRGTCSKSMISSIYLNVNLNVNVFASAFYCLINVCLIGVKENKICEVDLRLVDIYCIIEHHCLFKFSLPNLNVSLDYQLTEHHHLSMRLNLLACVISLSSVWFCINYAS
jgi:hypothetical protein